MVVDAENDTRERQSIREIILESLPSYAGMLAGIQEIVAENNKNFVENLIKTAHEIVVFPFFIPQQASVTSVLATAPFPIRGVIIHNSSGQNVYFGPQDIRTVTNDYDGVSGSFGFVPTARRAAIPVSFDYDCYFRIATSVTYAAGVYAKAWLVSQPINPMYSTV